MVERWGKRPGMAAEVAAMSTASYPEDVHRWHPTLLAAVAKRVDRAEVDRHLAELDQVKDRCHISRVKAAFLRRVRTAQGARP